LWLEGTGSKRVGPVEGDIMTQTPRTAAVTGAAGFVGVNLLRRLGDAGWKVRTVDIRPLAGVDTTGIDHTLADVRDHARLAEVFDGVDVVFHLAARITLATDDPEAWDVNVAGPATVAAAALHAGVPRLVHCSSVHAFDLSLAIPRLNELSPRSIAPERPIYDRSKFAGETEVRVVIEQGLDATIVNPTGIIGPIDLGPSRMNKVIDAAARGRLPVVVHGGFDWVDVRDVVDGLLAAVEHGRTGENYLLGGHQASALHLGRLAAALNGHLGPVVALPGRLAALIAPAGERVSRWMDTDTITPASIGTLIDDPVVECDKAREELGYEPRPLEDTVRDTVRWFEGEPRL
jgi:dihydroflavonol-4-reductase